MRRILCLHLPHLATERVRRDDNNASADGDRPLVLTQRLGGRLVVAQLCPRAAAAGVRAGETLGAAQAALPELRVWPHEPLRDRRALRRLARWADCFSPVVQPTEPDALLLDVSGCGRLFGGEERLAQLIVAGAGEQGFTARVAIADAVGAAQALATGARASASVTVVPPRQGCAYLAPLPVESLRLSGEVVERLAALGVRTVGDMMRLPRSTLTPRFGPEALQRLQQALGEVAEPLTPYRPAGAPTARRACDPPIDRFAAVAPVAQQLLADVAAQADRRALGVMRLDAVLYWSRRPPTTVRVRLSRPSCDWRHVEQMLLSRLETVDWSGGGAGDNEALVDAVGGAVGLILTAAETARRRPEQGTLFEDRDPDANEAIGVLIDRLASRLGEDAVRRPRLVDDHQPEFAFRYESARRAAQPMHSQSPSLRPVRLFSRPLPVRAMALAPDGPPTWFAYRGREHAVVQSWGPERIETAWWRGPDQRRDYFRVLTAAGAQYWLFRARDDGRWFLHGAFV